MGAHSGGEEGVGGVYSWEVGVELDMAELQQDILAIMQQDASPGLQQDTGLSTPQIAVCARQQGAGEADTPARQQGADVITTQQGASAAEQQAARDPRAVLHGLVGGEGPLGLEGGRAAARVPGVQRRRHPQQQQGPPPSQPSPDSSPLAPPSALSPPPAATTQSPPTDAPVWRNWWPARTTPRAFWRYIRQHKLQRWFGLDHFLVLMPHSYSRRLLVSDLFQGGVQEGPARTTCP